jgi:predicted O-linked N-acetylglucosamine transferase (SPINDLY family)
MSRDQKRLNKKIATKGRKNAETIQASSPIPAGLSIKQAIKLAAQYQTAGNLTKAEAIFQQVLEAEPNQPIAFLLLGLIAHQRGKNDTAVELLAKAISIEPELAEAHYNLGIALQALGKPLAAVGSYNNALTIRPDYTEVYFQLGITLRGLEKTDQAIVSYNKALAIKPDYAEACSNLGLLHQELGQLDDAVESYNKAIAIKPELAEAHANLGNALKALGQLDEAVVSYNNALAIKPDFVETLNNLGSVLRSLGQLDEAVTSYKKAIDIKPEMVVSYSNLAVVFLALGQFDDAMSSCKKAIAMKPDYYAGHSVLLSISTYGFYNASETYLSACRFGEIATYNALPISNHSNSPDPERQLRIGLVSGDFCHHPVGYLLLGIFSKINKQNIKLIVYSTSLLEDDFTAKIKPYVSEWRKVASTPDKQLTENIVADRIDILVDLSGHSSGNRLPLFAWKPAPIQVTWIGSNISTGIKEIDYILCDPWVIPEDKESYFVEQPWRLPNTWLCFAPPEFDIKEGSLPALENGFITFGCFNNLIKMNDTVVKCWSEVLKMVPNSKLFLKTIQLDTKGIHESILVNFEKNGILRDRLLLEGGSSRGELLASYQNVDIALDPFPYPGGITSMEALWMGVPVLSVNGGEFNLSGFGNHVAESTLHNVELSNWIARSPEDVAIKAKTFSSDLIALAELRKTLRQRLLDSPLCDSQAFADNLTNAFREMWRAWCRQANR